jgi:hypothetical protein
VEYRPNHGNLLEPKAKLVILAALYCLSEVDQYSLRVFFDPHWREFVGVEDGEYIESLLTDLAGRADQDAERLFKQLCSLCVGPLVTAEVGTGFPAAASLLSLVR